MRAKINPKDAAALLDVRADLKARIRKVAEEWRDDYEGALQERELLTLQLVTFNELDTGGFMLLLGGLAGARVITPPVFGDPEEIKELFRSIQDDD